MGDALPRGEAPSRALDVAAAILDGSNRVCRRTSVPLHRRLRHERQSGGCVRARRYGAGRRSSRDGCSIADRRFERDVKRAELYAIWADMESLWSQWTKPVLFAFMGDASPEHRAWPATGDWSWVPEPNAGVAMVVDLPGAESVWVGIELARRGYRPIPLYNALPFPLPPDHAAQTAVDVESILTALRTATYVL